MGQQDTTTRHPRSFIFLLLLYFGMAVWMAVRLPALATPNELLNFEYIQVMRQIRGLPNRGLVDSEIRYTEWHQPPLYFVFAAAAGLPVPVPPSASNPPPPIEWPRNPAFAQTRSGNLNPVVHITPQTMPLLYTSRIAATLLGVLGLAALYRAGRTIHGTAVALLATSLLAFQPNYIHLSGSVNNDMPLTAVAAMVLAYTALPMHGNKGPRWYFGLGLLAAAAILTKANGVFVLAYLAAALLALLLRHRDVARVLKSGLYALAGLLPLWAAWLALNTLRMRDTLGLSGSLPVDRVLALRPVDFALLTPWLDDIWRSFVLDWTAGSIRYGPDWFYLFWAMLLLLGLLGWLRPAVRPQRGAVALAVLLGTLAISYLYFAVKALTVKEAGYLVPEGRWWLPAMPGLAWLAAVGYERLFPARGREAALRGAALVPAVSTFLLLLIHFPALYPRATPLPATAVSANEPLLTYDNELALLSAALPPLIMGEEAQLELVWQALQDIDRDLLIVAQLYAAAADGWQILDEQRSYPGGGLDPTAGWPAGATFGDALVMLPDGPIDGPTMAHLLVQVLDGKEFLPAQRGETAVDLPVAATTVVRPAAPLPVPSPLPDPVIFADGFALAGVEAHPAGDDLALTLWWQAQSRPGRDYTIFVHVLDETGRLLAQVDGPPLGGASPTSIWRQGDVIREERLIPGGAAGTSLLAGAYDPATGARLPASQGAADLPDQAWRLDLAP